MLPIKECLHKCPGCSYQNTDLSAFQKHLKTHWGEKLRYACEIKGCPRVFLTHGHLLEHHRTHTGERPFQCRYCMKKFMRSNTLNVHLAKHRSKTPFNCPIEGCSKQYTEKGNLTKHIWDRHPGFLTKKEGNHWLSKYESQIITRPKSHYQQHTEPSKQESTK